MSETRLIDGELRDADGETVVRFDRVIDRPPALVWAALTDPKVLANWLGDVEIEPRVGGKYVLTFRDSGSVMTGVITVFEPERVLEYSWLEKIQAPQMPQSTVRWALTAAGEGCRLVLTHSFPKGVARKDILPFLGGWEAFLDALARGADGAFIPYASDEPYMARYRVKYP
ncbi:MAG TPA: SRPBCC family protein [Rhizomicrobium sp.]|jgi:uncharacterized protein YndB with AHSA1/START domain|nr:SRPBCC family protein [Rhizomicrobium sp.]